MITAKSNGATLGFEETLWQAADKLRGPIGESEYNHVFLTSTIAKLSKAKPR